MLIDWHAAAVITDLEGTVLVINDINPFGKTGNGFINGVVDNFLGQMVWPGGVGIHTRPASDRIKAFQHFQRGSVIGGPDRVLEKAVVFYGKPPIRLCRR
jgi:hypothetical protein